LRQAMRKKLLFDSRHLDITLNRLSQQLIENHHAFEHAVILGLQPRGIFLAELICRKLNQLTRKKIPFGLLDTTFHRDDFRRRDVPPRASETRIDFVIEGRDVILIDDVLYTGRTVRAAMDAMLSFGRPRKVELLVLVDRRHTRDLPIEANYVGKYVNTLETQKVLVELEAQGFRQNKIWLVNKD
jgi:pyrimidine operon attenuation protein/uracil phosphoribosyltransferase